MTRVTRTSLTIAMATLMIGLTVSQARADRVGYAVDRCFGANCVGGSVRVGELSLAFSESSLGTLDTAASTAAIGNFSPELKGIAGVSFAGSTVKTDSTTSAGNTSRAKTDKAESTEFLPIAGMSFSRLQGSAFTNSLNLGQSVTLNNSASFSVSNVALTGNKNAPAFWANGAGSGFQVEGPPGGDPGATTVPEPTTMLLLGTGLAGAAAIVRKRLKPSQR